MKIPETYEDFLAAAPEEISSYHVTYKDNEAYLTMLDYQARLWWELKEKFPYDVAQRLYDEKLGIKEKDLDFPDDFKWDEEDDGDEDVDWGDDTIVSSEETTQQDDNSMPPQEIIYGEEAKKADSPDEDEQESYMTIRLYNSEKVFYDLTLLEDILVTLTIHDDEFGSIEYKPEKLNYGPPGLSATLNLTRQQFVRDSQLGVAFMILVNYVTSKQFIIEQRAKSNEHVCEFYINKPKSSDLYKHEFFCNKETGIYLGDLKSYAEEMGLADKDEEYIRAQFNSDPNYRMLYRDYIDKLICEFNGGMKKNDITWENIDLEKSELRPLMIEIDA